jgi:glycolate oxidase
MALKKESYEALEDVVGPEYISQDPAIQETYNQVWGNKLVFGEKWSTRPAAVLLPGSTEEVQAIVRVCNRYKISFKPFSSGFEIMSTALASENAIILDLRRMNKILEIDVKNMHAVVEPYVSIYRLQLELAKHGLFIGAVSAGPEAGVIASHCCHFGSGNTQVFAGGLGRNVLGCEWVLPTGEILRMGSAEAGNGWYSADGPGFSLRGVLRGHAGANGGHGVITKCSAKLYPWYGPPEWQLVGTPPAVKRLEKVLDGFKAFVPTFATRDDAWDALREVGQAEIGFSVMATIGLLEMGEGNDELWEVIQKINPEEAQLAARSLLVVLGANTTREMEYRERCFRKIVDKWHGQLLPPLNDPKYLAHMFSLMPWSLGTIREVFRPCTDFFVSPCTDGTEDMIKNQNTAAVKGLMPYVQKGAIMQPGPAAYHLPYENYSVGSHIETVFLWDPYNDNSLQGVNEWIGETLDPHGKFAKFGVPLLGGGLQIEPVSHVVQNWGPVYDNYHVWLAKIKEALDPDNLGDWSAYVPPVFP